MEKKDLLDGKKILIVDDESDILEVLEDLLTMCNVVTATTFDEGKILLESEYFDLAILDIMGVNGYELLNIANKEKVTSVMLTAAALSPDNIVKSHKNGAAFFVPKPEMIDIVSYLNDILEAEEKGKSTWWRWRWLWLLFKQQLRDTRWNLFDFVRIHIWCRNKRPNHAQQKEYAKDLPQKAAILSFLVGMLVPRQAIFSVKRNVQLLLLT